MSSNSKQNALKPSISLHNYGNESLSKSLKKYSDSCSASDMGKEICLLLYKTISKMTSKAKKQMESLSSNQH